MDTNWRGGGTWHCNELWHHNETIVFGVILLENTERCVFPQGEIAVHVSWNVLCGSTFEKLDSQQFGIKTWSKSFLLDLLGWVVLISRLGSRRYPISEIKVARVNRAGFEPQSPCNASQELNESTTSDPLDLLNCGLGCPTRVSGGFLQSWAQADCRFHPPWFSCVNSVTEGLW